MMPVTRNSFRSAPAILAAAALLALACGSALSERAALAARGRVDVHLVRLLAQAPDSERVALGRVHDLKLRLLPGNVVLFRKAGDFAAFLPIERADGAVDSLRYFYFVEHPRLFWILPGARERGIQTVPSGGAVEFNAFRLLWRPDGPGAGWLYFPDGDMTKNLKFSVVSGKTIDDADPRDTKYWVELGSPDEPGF